MNLSQRIKTHPWLIKKRMPITYFCISAAVFAFLIFALGEDGKEGPMPSNIIAGLIFVVPYTIIFYTVYIAGKLLSENFTIKNHRSTPILLGYVIVISTILVFIIRVVVTVSLEIALIYPPAAALLITAVYIATRIWEGKSVSLRPYAVLAFCIGLTGYFVLSYLIVQYGGLSLILPAVGVLFAAAIFTLDYFTRKNTPKKAADLASLEARFDNYLFKVFKGMPALDEIFTLREQLAASLNEYASDHIASGEDEDKIFADALDSLGNFSSLIYKYKQNFFARIAGSGNRPANTIICLLGQIGLTLYYGVALKSRNWSETAILLFIFPFLTIAALFVLRIVENFRRNRHRVTFVLLGISILIPSLIIAILVDIDDKSNGEGIYIAFIGAGVFAVSLVTQIIFNIIRTRKAKLIEKAKEAALAEQALQDNEGDS